MDSLSKLTHRRTRRVRGPRPYSWLSSSSDSSSNEYQDVWPWSIQSPSLFRTYTQRSSSPDSSISSSSSHPVHPESYGRRRRKPAGPRAPRDSAYFDVERVGLVVNTSPSVIHRSQREDSPIMWGPTPVDVSRRSSQTPTSPTSYALDWDTIFELLGCSDPD